VQELEKTGHSLTESADTHPFVKGLTVYVCVCERERERESGFVCVRERV